MLFFIGHWLTILAVIISLMLLLAMGTVAVVVIFAWSAF